MLEPRSAHGSEPVIVDDVAHRRAAATAPPAPTRDALTRAGVVALQRSAGNQQVARLLAARVSRRTSRSMLQRVHLVRDRKTEKWRETRKNEPLHEPQPFTEWLAEGRPPQTLVEADTARLNGIEIEQIVDILARDGAVELARRVRDEGVGTRVRGGAVVDGFVAFGDRVRKLIATEPEAVTASAALKEVQELLAQAKDLRTSLGERMIVGAAAHGGVEGLRDSMAPVLEIAIGALERTIVALAQQPSAESEAEPPEVDVASALAEFKSDVARLTETNLTALLRWVRKFRSNKAYAPVTQGEQWTNAKVADRLLLGNDRPDPTTLSVLSKRNLETLHKEVDPLLSGDDGKQWKQLLARLMGLNYRIKHATPAFYAIANAGNAASLSGLIRRGAKHKASGMSSADNTTKLGNADFVFFRFEVGGAPMATRYGPTTMMFDPSLLTKHGGWVSLHDQLSPLDRPSTREFSDPESKEPLRTTAYPSTQGFKPGERVSWTHEYPATKGKAETSFLDEAFVGPDIIEGLALSIVREVHRIGGGFADKLLTLSPDESAEKVSNVLAELVKGLVRPEAKLPSSVALTDLIAVSDPSGDGRYYPDGSVHPEGMFAAVAADEASGIRQQIETFEDGYNRVAASKGADSKEAAFEQDKVANRYRELLAAGQVSIDRTGVFVQAATKENEAPTDVSLEDAREQLATANRVVPRRSKALEGWTKEAHEWGVQPAEAKPSVEAPVLSNTEAQAKKALERAKLKEARQQRKQEKASESSDTKAEASEPATSLNLSIGLPDATEVTRAAFGKAAKFGKASGVGNLCLLNTMAELAKQKGASDVTGESLKKGLLIALGSSESPSAKQALERLTGGETLNIYGQEGLIVLQHVMAEKKFRIQVLETKEGKYLTHPVQGDSGPIYFIIHSGEHFTPAWKKDS